VEDVEMMDPERFAYWLAFFKVTDEKRAKQQQPGKPGKR
jgi:hypothetical protein